MSLKTWMSAYMSIPAEKCTKSWKLGLATMILKYTGSSKKIFTSALGGARWIRFIR